VATGLVVTLTGVEQLRAKLTPALYSDAISRLISSLALTAERVARQDAPKDTSALARSIVSDVRPMSAVVYSPLVYAAPMEAGRRAGARMPPPAALEGWAQRHGFLSGKKPSEIKGILFVLARSIGRKGIKAHNYFLAAKTAVEQQMPDLVADAITHIQQAWSA
jgi:hypothetical protein